MALFIRGGDLKKEGGSIEEVIGANQALRDLIRECCGGYHVFDNGDTDLPQVTELQRKIIAILQRNGAPGETLEVPPEDYEVLQKTHAGKEARGGTSLMQACFDGAFAGACLQALRLALRKRLRSFDKHCISGCSGRYVWYSKFWGFQPDLGKLIDITKPLLW